MGTGRRRGGGSIEQQQEGRHADGTGIRAVYRRDAVSSMTRYHQEGDVYYFIFSFLSRIAFLEWVGVSVSVPGEHVESRFIGRSHLSISPTLVARRITQMRRGDDDGYHRSDNLGSPHARGKCLGTAMHITLRSRQDHLVLGDAYAEGTCRGFFLENRHLELDPEFALDSIDQPLFVHSVVGLS
jgi:hypothetical protein